MLLSLFDPKLGRSDPLASLGNVVAVPKPWMYFASARMQTPSVQIHLITSYYIRNGNEPMHEGLALLRAIQDWLEFLDQRTAAIECLSTYDLPPGGDKRQPMVTLHAPGQY